MAQHEVDPVARKQGSVSSVRKQKSNVDEGKEVPVTPDMRRAPPRKHTD